MTAGNATETDAPRRRELVSALTALIADGPPVAHLEAVS